MFSSFFIKVLFASSLAWSTLAPICTSDEARLAAQTEQFPRLEITSTDTILTIVDKMSENSGGARQVVSMIFETMNGAPRGLPVIRRLDAMNIRGRQLWIAYKEVAGESIDRFMAMLRKDPAALVTRLNSVMGSDYPHQARVVPATDF